jgi:hypothetical protein
MGFGTVIISHGQTKRHDTKLIPNIYISSLTRLETSDSILGIIWQGWN